MGSVCEWITKQKREMIPETPNGFCLWNEKSGFVVTAVDSFSLWGNGLFFLIIGDTGAAPGAIFWKKYSQPFILSLWCWIPTRRGLLVVKGQAKARSHLPTDGNHLKCPLNLRCPGPSSTPLNPWVRGVWVSTQVALIRKASIVFKRCCHHGVHC